MSQPLLFAFVMFALVMFFTPGPNNIMLLSSGLTYGFRRTVPHIAGIPRFIYRQALQQGWRWLRRLGSSDALDALIEELLVVEYLGFFVERWRPLAVETVAAPRSQAAVVQQK